MHENLARKSILQFEVSNTVLSLFCETQSLAIQCLQLLKVTVCYHSEQRTRNLNTNSNAVSVSITEAFFIKLNPLYQGKIITIS